MNASQQENPLVEPSVDAAGAADSAQEPTTI